MIKLVWREQAGYGDAYHGFANDVRLFTVSYSATKARGDPNSYVLSSYLPGIETVDGPERNELMIRAGVILESWIERIGVEAVIS